MKRKILIIDDSVVNINALYLMLRESYQIFVAKNGRDGIKEAKRNDLSLILLDILLPGMDGFEVLEQLKNDPVTKEIPVLFISGLNDNKSEEKGLAMGAVDVMVKPLNPSVIKAKVKNQIDLYEYRHMFRNLSMLDGLTLVPNETSYKQKLTEYWGQAKTGRFPISAAILNIDSFQEYNRLYGQQQGDYVLQQVAETVKAQFPKKRGIFARMRGAEFAVLLVGVREQEAADILDRMRQAVYQLGIEHRYSRAESVITISAGGITLVPEEEESGELFREVAKRLSHAKSRGGNCVVWEEASEVEGERKLSFFGNLKISSKNGSVELDARRECELAVFLAFLIRKRHASYTREELIQAVWSNKNVEDVANRVKRLMEEGIARLSKWGVGESSKPLIMREGCCYWNTAYLCSVDVEVFEQLFYEEKKEKRKKKQYELCERAIRLYKAPFLQKINDREWISQLRNDYEEMYCQLLEQLLSLCMEQGEYEKIIHLCQRDLYVEQFKEKIHWHYMKALIALGRKKTAMEHYNYMMEMYRPTEEEVDAEAFSELYLELVETGQQKLFTAEQAETMMKEEKMETGPFYCDFYVFRHLYQIKARMMEQYGMQYYLCIAGIGRKKYYEKKQLAIHMRTLFLAIKRTRNREDVFSKVSDSQYAILFACAKEQEAAAVEKEIEVAFHESCKEDVVEITTSLAPVRPAESVPIHVVL